VTDNAAESLLKLLPERCGECIDDLVHVCGPC
jgi:hypothetical protein